MTMVFKKLSLFWLASILTVMGVGGYFILGKKLVIPQSAILIEPSPTLSMTEDLIHPYPAYGADAKASINKVHIISLLFVPKDIDTAVKSEWLVNMDKIDSDIKDFFEEEFDYKIEISYEAVSQPIKGTLNISEYTPSLLVLEAKGKTNHLVESGSHNIWMVYLVRDSENKKNIIGGDLGGLARLQAATQFEFWLNDEAMNLPDEYGVKGSAHEFAHALGIPHPWELPANENNEFNFGNIPGDLMGYVNNGLSLDDLYIRSDVKKEMGL